MLTAQLSINALCAETAPQQRIPVWRIPADAAGIRESPEPGAGRRFQTVQSV